MTEGTRHRRAWRAAFVAMGLALVAVIVYQGMAIAATPPHASHSIRIANTTLVMRSKVASLTLGGGAPGDQVRWTLTGPNGAVSGVATFAGGTVSVGLRGTAAGYYTFGVQYGLGARVVEQQVGVAITSDSTATGPVGVTIHPNQFRTAVLQDRLADLRAIGVRYVRTDAPWAQIELSRGVYTFPAKFDADMQAITAAGMRPLLIPDYGNPLYDGGRTPSSAAGIAGYARFAAAVATHFPQADIEIYNEFNGVFNNGRCGTSARCYLQLATATRSAIRAASPSTVVVGPGAAGGAVNQSWIKSFVQARGLKQVDALTFHPYLGTQRPEQLQTTLDNVGSFAAGVPIWLTEFGYSTARGQISEAKQAVFLTRATAIALSNGVKRMYWYDAFNDSPVSTDKESNFGLFAHPNALAPLAWAPKAAASSVAWFNQSVASASMQLMPSTSAGTYLVRFRPSSGSGFGYITWSPKPRRLQVAPVDASMTRKGAARVVTVGPDPVVIRSSAMRMAVVAAK